jgi:hypothetical protein
MSVRNVPPQIPKDEIPKEGRKVKIVDARYVTEPIYTQIGVSSKTLVLEVEMNGQRYSHLFGLNKNVITGSAARLLSAVGVTNIDDQSTPDKVAQLKGKEVTVYNRGGKLYWVM